MFSACTHMHTHLHTSTHIYVPTHTCTHLHVHTPAYTDTHLHILAPAHTHTCTPAHNLPPHPELHSARRTAAILGRTPHLLLHLRNLALQPLDHAVQLADLHLDLLQAVSVLSSSYPELLILHGKRRRVI